MTTKKFVGIETLASEFGPMTLGLLIRSLREAQEISQQQLAQKLKISRAHLCDIEKGRRLVSPERAGKFAKIIKAPESTMIQLALQDLLRAAKLPYQVELKKVS
ncbi:helix-turn-helix transcriptional regulator [Bdellovibrio bacteriovorus]|nr:helix-turn-helix transcriptional regulator [Bdellovibrio bacteriovorus]